VRVFLDGLARQYSKKKENSSGVSAFFGTEASISQENKEQPVGRTTFLSSLLNSRPGAGRVRRKSRFSGS
jgi:hypothetical protein